jgi:hypothetical protein
MRANAALAARADATAAVVRQCQHWVAAAATNTGTRL